MTSMQQHTTAPATAPQWRAFLELGFRPLYVAGCSWAIVAVVVWVFMPGQLRGPLAGVAWHAHEMLWAFFATIALGFLLTACANWTGINPLKGAALAGLSLLWLVARVGYLLPGDLAFGVAVASELAFFTWGAAAFGLAIVKSRNRRNAAVPLLLLGLAVADALFLHALRTGNYLQLMQRFGTGMLCMAVIALLVARRVIPFFAMRAVAGLSVPMLTRAGQWQLAAGVLAIACELLQWHLAAALLLGVAGAIAFVHVVAWKPWATLRVPILWILYVGYAGLGAGLVVAALQAVAGTTAWPGSLPMRMAWPAHVVGMAGFAVLVIGMVTRTALGHLGRPLRADGLMVACYVLVIAATALRLLALVPSTAMLHLLHASAAAWALAFALYLWRFIPLLVRPRLRA